MKIYKSTHSAEEVDIAIERAKGAITTINGLGPDSHGNIDMAEVGTVIVETLPNKGETGIDYILKSSGGYILFKWIDNQWSSISGSQPYIGTALPSVNDANELTDYYIKHEGKNYYTHYRFINGEFEPISSGGSSSSGSNSSTIILTPNGPTSINVSPSEKFVISVNYICKDSNGVDIPGTYVWKLGNTIVKQGSLISGTNDFPDLYEKLSGTGTKYLQMIATNYFGEQSNPLIYSINIVDLGLESDFNDTIPYDTGKEINFSYKPIGTIEKTIHIKLDGEMVHEEVIPKNVSGSSKPFTIPPQTHGAHLIECYLTTSFGSQNIESDHIYRDIICFDKNSDIPIIGCRYRTDYRDPIEVDQYTPQVIPYVVYSNYNGDMQSNVIESINGVTTSKTLTKVTDELVYPANEYGIGNIIISCGKAASVNITMNVKKLNIAINPITSNLAFDFNPVGYSNTSQNRLWQYSKNNNIKLSVSENFDWYNGGYVLDEDGNACFCVKSGTRATISYNLFDKENDPSKYGASFKCIFKTTNVKQAKAQFLNCASPDEGIGIEMNVHEAYLRNSASELYIPYSEEDIIEFDYTINDISTKNSKGYAVAMSYEDGVPLRPMQYNAEATFYQSTNGTVPITIGSDDCDTYIYRMKAYTASLSAEDVLDNFIADARTSPEMLDRYNRNQIFDDSGNITPDSVYNACPDLKIVMIDCKTRFTSGKGFPEKCDIQIKHKNGRLIEDNWSAINCYHTGQGTSSDSYGYSGRNVDIILCLDGTYGIKTKNDGTILDPNYITELTMGDGTVISDGTGKVTLTKNSIPNAYFNIKVNIASSENANNALLAKRFNDYLPYQSIANKNDPRVKNTMEFVNCVVFIRENDPDINIHNEFNDNEWHFYALGNIGDSKNTDITRVNDPNDVNEFVVEISDWNRTNASFDTGVYKDNSMDTDKMVYPISKTEWNSSNPKYYDLHNNWYKDEEDNVGGKKGTYEFRYEHPDVDKAQTAKNINKWNQFYEWVITSTDKQFVNELNHWFIENSALYYYLFTERFTMVDNRAKNTFWHYSRVYDVPQFTGDDGYRFEFWDYDNDTSLGINNSGKLTMPYGMEDDNIFDSGEYVFRAAYSVFFRRIRELLKNKLAALHNMIDKNAWDSYNTINEFENWQNQFPEALWIRDMKRKYLRTFTGESYDNSKPGKADDQYLIDRYNGRKKYQRRQFERDQDIYIATKYISSKITTNHIYLRCTEKTPESSASQDFTIKLVPYQDMYVTVLDGETPLEPIRAKAGELCIFTPKEGEKFDIIRIYAPSRIQEIHDLSRLYLHEAQFPQVDKLKVLTIGSDQLGYIQKTLPAINLGYAPILEKLDITNCAGLEQSPAIYGCKELREFYANGTLIRSVSFAPNGKIETAYLPDSVNTISMENLMYLKNLRFSFDNINRLTIKDSNINTLNIVNDTIDTLTELTLTGINWTLPSTGLLNQLLPETYGGILDTSSLAGTVTVTGAIRNQELLKYAAAWPDLKVNYNVNNVVPQYLVTYVNADKNNTVLHTEWVDIGGYPPNPYADGKIEMPTIESDEQYNYTFSDWNDISTPVSADRTVVAVYDTSIRTYTVNWYDTEGGELLWSDSAEYGQAVTYGGRTLTTAIDVHLYKVFSGWDKSTGFIRNDTDVYAVWDSKTIPNSGTKLENMSPAEIYAIFKTGRSAEFVSERDHFDMELGHNFEFKNVHSEVITTDTYFNAVESDVIDTEYKLFGAYETSFTIAIDMRFIDGATNATILSCYEINNKNGFRIRLNGNALNVDWGDSTPFSVSYKNYRDMIVLRHRKGENQLYVYTSTVYNTSNSTASKYFNLDSVFGTGNPRRKVLTSNTKVDTEFPLTLGGLRYANGTHSFYAKGMVHWCKIWFDDIGNAACEDLACWHHEKLRMEFCDVGMYNYAGTGTPCIASFMANNLLKDRGMKMLSSNTNADWSGSLIRTFFNERLYQAIPTVWKSLIRQVNIDCTPNSTSAESIDSDDYLYIPSRNEINGGISFMDSTVDHVKFSNYMVPVPCTNYTGSTDPQTDIDLNVRIGDIWTVSGISYMLIPTDDINKFGLTVKTGTSITSLGGWVAANKYWTRTLEGSYSSSQYTVVDQGGSLSTSAYSTQTNKICLCFSM